MEIQKQDVIFAYKFFFEHLLIPFFLNILHTLIR